MNNSMILSRTARLEFDNDCLNKNVCVIGSPGSGKTYSFVEPNILQLANAGHSMIVSETKANLSKKFGKHLEELGYEVKVLDLINPDRSVCYDPFKYVENERDVLTFSNVIAPYASLKDPYWDNMAKYYIQALVAYICLEETDYPKKLSSLLDLFSLDSSCTDGRGEQVESSEIDELMAQLEETNPSSFAVQAYNFYAKIKGASTTTSCILSTVSEKLLPFTSKAALRVFAQNELDFRSIGEKKTAVFVNISDNDRSMDRIGSVFFTQLLNILVRHADEDFEDYRLPVPVDFIIDDFGTQTVIPDFDKMIASIRSRNISVSIVLQSVNQLGSGYGDRARTIIACCDTQLYFGSSDEETIKYTAMRADVSEYEIMNMARWKVWVLRRCKEPFLDDAFRFCDHPDHKLTGDADKSRCFLMPVREFKLERNLVNRNRSKAKMLSYENAVDMDGFIEKMKRIVGSHANNPTNVKAKCKHSGCICYSAVMISDSALVLCLFEGRKQLLDQLYYDRMIRPIITHYKLPPNLIMLVSYSGFTGEEVSFANNNRIGLIDRTGFTSPYNNLMVNPDVFRLTRMRHGLNSRP